MTGGEPKAKVRAGPEDAVVGKATATLKTPPAKQSQRPSSEPEPSSQPKQAKPEPANKPKEAPPKATAAKQKPAPPPSKAAAIVPVKRSASAIEAQNATGSHVREHKEDAKAKGHQAKGEVKNEVPKKEESPTKKQVTQAVHEALKRGVTKDIAPQTSEAGGSPADEQDDEEHKDTEAPTKDQEELARVKREAHARYMRFRRSLESNLPAYFL